ncbi:Putative AC transposase [Linum perenne]
MVITAHFVDNDWVLQSRILRFLYVPSPHTNDVLCDVLLECLIEWDIERKLNAVTVDNCTTNDAMIRALTGKLEEETLILRGTLLHMRCAAHILNLVVQDGLSVIEGCIESVRDSVIHWTASPKRRQKFTDAVRHSHITSSLELVLDCKTRWNSTYLMLSTALIYRDAFFRLKLRDPSYTSMPSDEEWDLAHDICLKLAMFHEVTKVFSGTIYPTSNLLFPSICEVKVALRGWIMTSGEVIKKMAEKMLKKFDRYWEVIEGPMAIAIVLDPRYKLRMDYKEEFEKYLREPLLSRTQNFDILLWWKHQEVNYPTLRLIAKDILAIPISTVISESAFSTSGRLLCENRSTLDPKTVEALMCNQNWLRNEINGKR